MEREHVRLAFEAFHRANPQLLIELALCARQLVALGVPPGRASIWTLVYRLRWVTLVDRSAPGATVFDRAIDGLINDFSPYYARLIMTACPDLAGFLVTAPMREEYTPDLVELGIVAASASPLPPPPPPLVRKASALSP